MKVYILKDEDFARLRAEIARNPDYGQSGGGSRAMSEEEKQAHKEAHRFYNYIIEKWISSIQRG